MLTKYEIAERYLKAVQPRLTTDNPITLQEAMQTVDTIRDKVVQGYVYALHYKEHWHNIDALLSTFTVRPVREDGQWYAYLPATPLELPKDMGLYRVGYEDDYDFIKVKEGSRSMYRNMSSSVLPRDTYWVVGDKMYFGQDMNEKRELIVKMVAMSKDIKPRSYYPLHPTMVSDILTAAIQRHEPEDVTNNNKGVQ